MSEKKGMPLEVFQDKRSLLQNNLFFKNYNIDFERVGAFGVTIKDGIASV